jgi:hypothetical protein
MNIWTNQSLAVVSVEKWWSPPEVTFSRIAVINLILRNARFNFVIMPLTAIIGTAESRQSCKPLGAPLSQSFRDQRTPLAITGI